MASGDETGWIARSARAVSRGALGRRAGQSAYGLAARLAGERLARLEQVEGVYVTGSVATGGVAPGFSDIDLLLVVELPTLEAELALRHRLVEWQRRANALGPLFAGLDYVEARDVEGLARGGDAWTLDMARRFRRVGGRGDLLGPATVRPARELRLLRLSKVMRRFCKVSAATLREGDSSLARRMTRRLERALHAPGSGGDAFERLAAAGSRLAEAARAVTVDWRDALPSDGAPDRTDARLDLARACDAVRVCSRDTACVERFVVCVTEGCDPPRIRHLSSVVRASSPTRGWLPGPIWMPAAAWSALAALEPAPVAALSVAGASSDGLSSPRWPPPGDRRVLLRAERAHLPLRARGRALRARRAPTAALARMARDVRLHAPALDRLQAGARLRFAPGPPPRGSERELLIELRGWLDRERGDA